MGGDWQTSTVLMHKQMPLLCSSSQMLTLLSVAAERALCCCFFACRIWTPKYWTSQSVVAFNFTGFMDYESGISRYQWGIGSSQFAADVVPLTNVTGERVLKDIKYSGGTKKMFVTPVVRQLLMHGPGFYRHWLQ
jgi:hypothetical protein